MWKVWPIIRQLFWPNRCAFCKRVLGATAEFGICAHCMKTLPFSEVYPSCKRCGRPVPEGTDLCNRCNMGLQTQFRKVYAPYLYRGAVKRSLVRFKMERYQSYARIYAVHLAAVMKNKNQRMPWEVVVAVPSRKGRSDIIDYNQAEVLGKALAKELELPFVVDSMYQVARRKKQSTLAYRDRRANVRGNFRVRRKDAVLGKGVLLVDDISTTGATLDECAKILKAAGAKWVDCGVGAIVCQEKNL